MRKLPFRADLKMTAHNISGRIPSNYNYRFCRVVDDIFRYRSQEHAFQIAFSVRSENNRGDILFFSHIQYLL